MKKFFVCLGFVFILAGVLAAYGNDTADERWLKAAVHMVVDSNDRFVSTTDINRVASMVQWAVANGYSVKIANRDWTTGLERKEMYFLSVDKLQPLK